MAGGGFVSFVVAMGALGVLVAGYVTQDWRPEFHPRTPVVYRDAGTGCEYVATPDRYSALTPRLGADGRPVCGGEDER